MSSSRIGLFIGAGLLIAAWAWFQTRSVAPRQATYSVNLQTAAAPVKILMFYANVGELDRGEKALLCYGVENAKSVEISPLTETVPPSLNRCFEISPQHTTHYAIVAHGFDGKVATESLTLAVNAPLPPPPQILQFAAEKQPDGSVKLCYQAAHAERVAIDPPVVPPNHAPVGCFGVAPVKTTTYTLSVFGTQNRSVQKKVTVTLGGSS